MSTTSVRAFAALVVLIGAINIFLGINVGFGGLQTLGWQGDGSFFTVTDEHLYLIRDSHIRFYGGLYIGIGLFLILSVTDLLRYRTALNLVFVLIFAGGLARLTVLRPDVIFGAELVGSLVAELVLMPVLYFWLARIAGSYAERRPEPTIGSAGRADTGAAR